MVRNSSCPQDLMRMWTQMANSSAVYFNLVYIKHNIPSTALPSSPSFHLLPPLSQNSSPAPFHHCDNANKSAYCTPFVQHSSVLTIFGPSALKPKLGPINSVPCVRPSVRASVCPFATLFLWNDSLLFLIFCMKLDIHNGSKLTFCFFEKNFRFRGNRVKRSNLARK